MTSIQLQQMTRLTAEEEEDAEELQRLGESWAEEFSATITEEIQNQASQKKEQAKARKKLRQRQKGKMTMIGLNWVFMQQRKPNNKKKRTQAQETAKKTRQRNNKKLRQQQVAETEEKTDAAWK